MSYEQMFPADYLTEDVREVYVSGCDPSNGKEWVTKKDGTRILKAFNVDKLSVDTLLDNVDLKLNWYIPSKYAIEFMVFIRLVLGEEPENTNPKAHYFFIDCIFRQPNVKPFFMARGIDYDSLSDRIVILATREFSKSVLVTFLILFIASKGELYGFGKVSYMLYVADSMRNNVETTMLTIASVYNESKYLKSIFEDASMTVSSVVLVRKPDNAEEYVEMQKAQQGTIKDRKQLAGRSKRTFKLVGLGANTGGRGTRSDLSRPDGVIFDDMVSSEKDATSDNILKAIESTIEADVIKGLNNNNNFAIMLGTPYNKKDPVYRRIELETWLPVVFPRGESLPSGTKEEFVSVWEDRHSYENCRRDYVKALKAKENGDPIPMRSLLQEHYLRISNEEDRMIPDSLIKFYNRSDIIKNLSGFNLYMTTDYTSSSSRVGDLSGIAVWALSSNNDYMLLDLTLKHMDLKEQYEETFRLANKWGRLSRGIEIAVEVDGNQATHIYSLEERMIRTNQFFTFAKQKGETNDKVGIRSASAGGKHWRFKTTMVMWQQGKIFFPKELMDTPDLTELLEELKYVSYEGFGSKYDDGLDLISQLTMIKTITPMPSVIDSTTTSNAIRRQEGIWSVHDDDIGEPSAFSGYL